MSTLERGIGHTAPYPVEVQVEPALEDRDRLTTAFRLILAIPHLLLVGGPIALALSWTWARRGIRASTWARGACSGRWPRSSR